ncbi:glutathione S-transferase family protein [Thalassotalea sp. M1531]|uniref:Glutathione S-transferase family protein n=1 Tax=Thalassotalea algicola TaxID=2716224 RepID=A0A7Y0Q5Q4_9GAMM|nr:glutathione S-transferase family protein [Thalassotalea algicola]NMP31234.1 glutathione S-transferase family protein [Thalassotalea algicola]
MATILGVAPSPYVRKVILAHEFKQMPYQLKTVFPGSDDSEFRAASPLGKVPGYITDDGFAFSDSSVIIAYLERTNNQNNLYPQSANDYAKALWLEEYSDTKMTEVTAALYFQRVIGPLFFNHTIDETRCQELCDELIPPVLDYLESELQEDYFVGEQLSVADVSIGGGLINLFHADFQIDDIRWPKLSQYQQQFMSLDIVQNCIATEKTMFNQAKSS